VVALIGLHRLCGLILPLRLSLRWSIPVLGCLAGENFVCAVRKKFFTPDAMVFIVEYFFLFWLKKLKKC
jgi:hypothetical protein